MKLDKKVAKIVSVNIGENRSWSGLEYYNILDLSKDFFKKL